MAAKRKPVAVKKTVADENYSELDMYCIWLNEYYKSLLRAGFKPDVAMTVMMDKESYPDWIKYGKPTQDQIRKYLEDEDD